ncbi:MAG: hypothetical protein HN764_14725 [Gammaproteobacteria bacterium]|jgi:uncharacterized protein (TIGR02001 family)|nr:hypothetical protein [Gammaproteobacteria bacterium]
MKKFAAGIVLGISSLCTTQVYAEDSPHEFSANVSMLTDYLYRGISQTNENFALQGGFDYAHAPTGVYVGTWASNIDFAESLEIDIYGGISGELGNGISWDVGGLYYMYPGSNAQPEEDFFEAYANLGYTFKNIQLEPTVGAGVAYSPDFFGEDGDGVYVYGSLDLSLPNDFGLSFYVGHQDIEGDKLSGPAGFDYVHYSIGISRSFGPADLSISWNDASDECDGGTNELCQAVVFSVGSSF